VTVSPLFRHVVRARLARLGPGVQQLLAVAAVIMIHGGLHHTYALAARRQGDILLDQGTGPGSR
jgi:hypothetical protein